MTKVDVKEWFRQMPKIEARIRSREAQIRKYRDMATRATSSTEATRVFGSSNRSRVEDAVVRICDLEQDAREDLNELKRYRRDVMAVIRRIRDVKRRDILEMHYVTGWSLERIADEMHYHVRWVQILHGQALTDARDVLRTMPETVRFYSLEIGD